MKTNYAIKNFFFLFLFLFFAAPSVFCQSVSGILINKKTQEAVPYAEILVGEKFISVTNAEGEFSINDANFSVRDSITFFSYGFLPKKIAVADINSEEIRLSPDENLYPSSQYVNTQKIMAQVNERLEQNYANEFSKLKIYHRTKSTSNILDLEIEKLRTNFLEKETSESIRSQLNNILQKQTGQPTVNYCGYVADLYIGEDKDFKLNLEEASAFSGGQDPEARQFLKDEILPLVEDKMHLSSTYKVKSGLFTFEDALDFKNICKSPDSTLTASRHKNLKNFLRENRFYPSVSYTYSFVKYPYQYNYNLEQITEVNGEKILVLSFSQNKNKGRYTGKLFISAEDFAVLRADYQLVEGEGMGANLKFLLGVKFETNDAFGTIIFHKNPEGKYVPRFVSSTKESTGFVKRKLKFKENSNSGGKQKIRSKFRMEKTEIITHDFLVLEEGEITPAEYTNFKENKGVQRNCLEKIDPVIWEGHNSEEPNAISTASN